MKIYKFLVAVALLFATISCREGLPKDSSNRFAADVVSDIYNQRIILPLTDISIMHKVSEWRDCDDAAARYDIENKYFSKIAPRINGNTITVITQFEKEISIEHNNISLVEDGAHWVMVAENNMSQKKITIKNVGGELWQCTEEEPNGDVTSQFNVEWNGIDNYLFTMNGSVEKSYANSPVVSQRFFCDSKLALRSPYHTPYPIHQSLCIFDGSFNIELLSWESTAIEGDDMIVTFQDCEYEFNPLIIFRGKKFYYTDIYNNFYYE